MEINTYPERTTPVTTEDMRAMAREVCTLRDAISRNARMIREEKIYLFGRLKVLERLIDKQLQLSFFSPAQRSHG